MAASQQQSTNPSNYSVSSSSGSSNVITDLENIFGQAATNVFGPIVAAIDAALGDFWNAASGAINSIFGSLFSSIVGFINDAHNAWVAFVQWLGGIWTNVSAFFSGIFGDVLAALSGAWNALATWFGQAGSFLDTLWNEFTSAVRTFIADVVAFFSGLINWIISGIHAFALGAINAVHTFLFTYIINPFIGFIESTLAGFLARMDYLITYWTFIPQVFGLNKSLGDSIEKNGVLKGVGYSIAKMGAGFMASYFSGVVAKAFLAPLNNPTPQLPRAVPATISVSQATPLNAPSPGSTGISNPLAVATVGTSVGTSMNRLKTFSATIGTTVQTQLQSFQPAFERPTASVDALLSSYTTTISPLLDTVSTSFSSVISTPITTSTPADILITINTSISTEIIAPILAVPIDVIISTSVSAQISGVVSATHIIAAISTSISTEMASPTSAKIIAIIRTSVSGSVSGTSTTPFPNLTEQANFPEFIENMNIEQQPTTEQTFPSFSEGFSEQQPA
jgi:hypothetical protein